MVFVNMLITDSDEYKLTCLLNVSPYMLMGFCGVLMEDVWKWMKTNCEVQG